MRLKFLLAATGILFFAAGCKSKIAMDYNDMIAKKEKSLELSMNESEDKLKNYFSNFEYDSIASVSSKMESKIDSIVAEIKRTPAPKVKQGENFKKAALQYFVYMKSIYTSYKDYGLQTTPEGRQVVAKSIIPEITGQEDKMIADMHEAQRIFAKDNGFKIKSSK